MQQSYILPESGSILAGLPLPILLMNDANRIIFANDHCETYFDRARKRIEGESITELLDIDDSRLRRALDSGEEDISAQKMRIKLPSGHSMVDIMITAIAKPIGTRMIVLIPRGNDRGYIGETESDGQQQAMGAPAILGHEIKNPLAGIKGAAQLLAKRGGNDIKPLTELIVNEVDRIARLLDQMQNLGRVQAGQMAYSNIHLVIERAIRSIRAANSELPMMDINYDPSLPDVWIDEDSMVQIIINLLQNAIDALGQQEDRQIGISTRFVMSGAMRGNADDSHIAKMTKLPVELIISDNGPGVADYIANEIFSPFVTSKREGQGLGLAIVRKLIKQCNGRISFERDAKRGLTLFRLNLPITPAETL